MTTPEQQSEILNSISKIITATRAKQAVWTRANPTTLVWTKPPGRLIVQRVEQSKPYLDPVSKRPSITKVTSFLFQVISTQSNAQLLSFNSTEETVFAPALEELYKTAEETLLSQGLDILKNILP